MANEGKGRLSEDDVAALVTKCSNTLWSLRESSLLDLAAQVDLTPPSRALLAQAPKIVEVAAERVSDAHYKVQQAALTLLASIASHLSACLSPHLDAILRQILPRLVDKKEGSRKACVALLHRLYHSCGPQVLYLFICFHTFGTTIHNHLLTLSPQPSTLPYSARPRTMATTLYDACIAR